MTTRTDTETRILREEAERLVRMNWKRTQIARTLGVPLHTLARWAYEGGWRAKDLAAEGEPERLAALNEQIAARRAQEARMACGRPVEWIEHKSADALRPPGDGPSSEGSGEAGHGENRQGEPLPKFLTRGGDPNEQVRWAAPQLWARTPPWAPGNEIEEPEFASLWLAEDLMRQGLLVEAERALRFTKNWLKISRQVFDKQDEEDARRLEYQQQQKEEHQREKARCKALGLPDPDEVWNARLKAGLAQFADWERRQSSNNNTTTQQQPSPMEQGAG
jgi:hypothetical protein